MSILPLSRWKLLLSSAALGQQFLNIGKLTLRMGWSIGLRGNLGPCSKLSFPPPQSCTKRMELESRSFRSLLKSTLSPHQGMGCSPAISEQTRQVCGRRSHQDMEQLVFIFLLVCLLVSGMAH